VATLYTAKENESLCIIAIREGGFLNCDSLRNAPGNEAYKDKQIKKGQIVNIPDKEEKEEGEKDEKKHKHKKKNAPIPQVRFVHGSKWKKAKDDSDLTVLQISNFPTDKAGFKQNKNFPNTSKFNANANIDPDTFRVEVVDYEAKKKKKKEVEIELEALKPVYQDDGKITHEPFKAGETDLSKCKIKIKCKQIRSSLRYRSKYMRLVVDEEDFNAAPGRILLIPDLADGKDGDEDKIEILDQRVRATYELLSCPKGGAAKCKVWEQLYVGDTAEKQRIKLAVHILRKSRDGDGVVKVNEARKACLQYIKQVYAQAELSVKFVDPKVRLIQPPTNMIVIEDKTNPPGAEGGKKIKFKIKIDDGTTSKEKTLEYTTVEDELPKKTAEKIAANIKTLFSADFNDLTVTNSANPTYKKGGTVYYTADILIGDPQKYKVEIDIEEQHDTYQKFTTGEIVSTTINDFDNDNIHVGTAHERVLIKNSNSGKDHIDMFVVEALSSSALGEAFWKGATIAGDSLRIDKMVNSIVVYEGPIKTFDLYHTVIAHEIGHVLLDNGNHLKRSTELMFPTVPQVSRAIDGPKRISDQNLDFDDGSTSGNPIELMRENSKEVIDGW
jgi:hypothetical protein